MPWTNLIAAMTTDELTEKLQEYWEAVAVVAALIGTMSYSGVLEPPPDVHSSFSTTTGTALRETYTTMKLICCLSSLATCSSSVIFYAQINQLPNSTAKYKFIENFQGYFTIPSACFMVGIVAMIFGVIFSLFLQKGIKAVSPWIALVLGVYLEVLLFWITKKMQNFGLSWQQKVWDASQKQPSKDEPVKTIQ